MPEPRWASVLRQDDLFSAPQPVTESPPPLDEEPPVEESAAEAVPTDDEGPPTDDLAQAALFDMTELEWWREHWVGMPEFVQEDLAPWKTISVHFESRARMQEFARIMGQNLTDKTQSIWFPKAEIDRMVDKRFIDG